MRRINISVLFSIEKVKILLFGLLTFLLIFPAPNRIYKPSLIFIIHSANSLLFAHNPSRTLLVAALLLKFHHILVPIYQWFLVFVLLFVHELSHSRQSSVNILFCWHWKWLCDRLNKGEGTLMVSRNESGVFWKGGRMRVGNMFWSWWKAMEEEECCISYYGGLWLNFNLNVQN